MIVIAVDVGIRNFAFVVASVTPECTEFLSAHKYDLYKAAEGPSAMPEVAGLSRVLDRHRLDFLRADVVVVERQPPGGILSIQAVLFDRFQSKIVLAAPQTMHKHHGLRGLDYEGRKRAVESIACGLFDDTACLPMFSKLPRKHDVADAACYVAWYAAKWRKKQQKNIFAKHAYCGQNFQWNPQLPHVTKVVMGSSAERVCS
jgi:hypothetical protein